MNTQAKSFWFLSIQISPNRHFNFTCRSKYSIWEREVIIEAIKINSPNLVDPTNFTITFALELTEEQYNDDLKFNTK